MTTSSRRWLGLLALCAALGCGDDHRTIRVTPTAGPEGTATPSVPPVDATATPSVPPVDATATPTADSTAAATGTSSPGTTPTAIVPTATPAGTASGPVITYLGVSAADDRPVASSGTDAAGRPIFSRILGTGLNLIVEARRGVDNAQPGNSAFDQGGGLPDLQMLVSRPLGDGSAAVCDVDLEGPSGGVPGVDPPVFSNASATEAVINDLGCRVNDGTGVPRGRSPSQACTRFATGDFRFVDAASAVQFCMPIARAWAFPQGDTIVTARVRSARGSLGDPVQIVVRVEREAAPLTPLPTHTPGGTPVPTRTPVPPLLSFVGVASADDRLEMPVDVDEQGRPIYERLLGHAFTLIVEGAPGGGGRPIGINAYDSGGLEPDLQILVSRDLGDGSEQVCDFDIDDEIFGGIPGIDPPLFSSSPSVVGAMNDLGCRVNDGTGVPVGRPRSTACTRTEFGDFEAASPLTTVQFCLPIAKAWSFPVGDTIVAARVRSIDGGLSEVGEIVVRVREGESPFECDASGLGMRSFSVARPGSGLLTAETAVDVSSDPWLADDLDLCAGVDTGDGVRSLRLLKDAILGFAVQDGSVVCAKLFARDSGGILDCDGVQGHDVERALDAISGVETQEIGLGDPAGPGSATLSLPVSLVNLPAGTNLETCRDQSFGFAPQTILTTAVATGSVTNSSETFPPMLTVEGAAFDCSQWSGGGDGGLVLVWPLLAQPGIGDTVLGLVLQD